MLGKLFKTVVDTATTPIAVLKDIASFGGAAAGRGSYTKEKLEQIADDLDSVL